MKTFWTIAALVGFISLSLFGLLSITHQDGHMAECLASRLNGLNAPCPQADPIGFANFHSSALKVISNFIIVDNVAALYFIAFALLLFGLSGFIKFPEFSLSKVGFYRPESHPTGYLPLSILSWLALHEKRDPASVF